MGTWNYRMMAIEINLPNRKKPLLNFQIREVYYDNNQKIKAYSETPPNLAFDAPIKGFNSIEKEFAEEIIRIQAAMNRPIIWAGKKFPQEYKSKKK